MHRASSRFSPPMDSSDVPVPSPLPHDHLEQHALYACAPCGLVWSREPPRGDATWQSACRKCRVMCERLTTWEALAHRGFSACYVCCTYWTAEGPMQYSTVMDVAVCSVCDARVTPRLVCTNATAGMWRKFVLPTGITMRTLCAQRMLREHQAAQPTAAEAAAWRIIHSADRCAFCGEERACANKTRRCREDGRELRACALSTPCGRTRTVCVEHAARARK